MATEEPRTQPIVCQLKKYEPALCTLIGNVPDKVATTASEWFSQKWPEEAERYGCPFLEAKYVDEFELAHVNPIALNEIFFASILAGDKELGHKVVFYTPDQQFYFKDQREEGKFKPTTEDMRSSCIKAGVKSCHCPGLYPTLFAEYERC
jgi:hypothetical protein